ncbi:hypothetical protein M0802_002964 [Mischocyttarus mexicanus]|nr:hypothetical protein M0802_002964 [Mischocyttarus mexicanus]
MSVVNVEILGQCHKNSIPWISGILKRRVCMFLSLRVGSNELLANRDSKEPPTTLLLLLFLRASLNKNTKMEMVEERDGGGGGRGGGGEEGKG